MANQHIIKHKNGWAVRGEGNKKDTYHTKTQEQAFNKARNIAEHQGGDVIIHNRKNKIRERNTYGKKDPFPPKG
ncbi:MAG TPA: DUF2188 domain-containing protein [Balneolales bacterium]|nr:DUF2188 domain-containing protein [Balneolales bacterium]